MARDKCKQIADIAARIGKSSRTLRRWMAEGCDITSDESLKQFAEHQALTAKGKAIQTTELGPETPTNSAELGELPPPGEKGAVQALTRLQALEVLFDQRLRAAIAKGYAKPIASARDDYTKIAESLRRYEKEIEESRRDLGHLIPRGEAIDGARASAMWMRLSFASWLSSFLPDILALSTDARAAKAKALATMMEIVRVSAKNAEDASLKLPDWARDVILEEFHCT